MRKLVSVQKISEIKPIPNAESIEVAKVLGWSVVVQKGEFEVGDNVVYAEIDSVFPEKEEFEFLRPRQFRIRTIKLRKQVSQGICFPLSILPPGEYVEGQDVTDLVGVYKYEPKIPECLDGIMKGAYPSFFHKTGEARVQVLQEFLTMNKGKRCTYTEKLDGTSTTFYINEGDFGVCSKALDILESENNVLWKMAKKYNIEEKMRDLNINIALQGETIGSGIRKNKYKLPQDVQEFYLFNVFDIDTHQYLSTKDVKYVANLLGLPIVPILEEDYILTDDIDELVELSKGYSKINNSVKREGVVYVINHETGEDRESCKAINPDFLLKFDE